MSSDSSSSDNFWLPISSSDSSTERVITTTNGTVPIYGAVKPYLNTGDIKAEDIEAESIKLTARIDCVKCKRKDVPVGVAYTWGVEAPKELDRKVCQECYCKALDKILGLGEDRVDAEKILYGGKGE